MTLANATTSWFEFADAHLPFEGFDDTANTACKLDVGAACVIRDPKLKFPWKGILRIYVRDSEESFERDSRVIRSSVRPMCVTVKRKVNKNMTSVNLLARNVCRGVEIFKSS